MMINLDWVMVWLTQIWWPFLRIGATLIALPIFGNLLIPVQFRILMALSLAILISPHTPTHTHLPSSLSLTLITLSAMQILWGILFGLILHFLFSVLTLLGQIISLQMGLGMAIMNDPANGVATAVLSRFFLIFGTLLFLSFDAHLIVIDILLQSFTVWPIDSGLPPIQGLFPLFNWMFGAALALALPAILAMLLVNISFGVMNKAAPSLNIFALGFPMTMLLGVTAVALSITGLPARYATLTHQALEHLITYTQGTLYE